MENPTYDPDSVSNILSCSTLPDFLTGMSLIIFTLDMPNGITLLDTYNNDAHHNNAGVFIVKTNSSIYSSLESNKLTTTRYSPLHDRSTHGNSEMVKTIRLGPHKYNISPISCHCQD